MTKERIPSVEAIRRRAFEISQGPDAGTPEENWLRAEEELRRPGVSEDPTRREESEAARDAQHGELLQAEISSFTHP